MRSHCKRHGVACSPLSKYLNFTVAQNQKVVFRNAKIMAKSVFSAIKSHIKGSACTGFRVHLAAADAGAARCLNSCSMLLFLFYSLVDGKLVVSVPAVQHLKIYTLELLWPSALLFAKERRRKKAKLENANLITPNCGAP